jgi:hypothetical protein
MSFFSRLDRAIDAFRAAEPVQMRSMPTPERMAKIRGPETYLSRKGKKPFHRLPWHNRRWMPPNVEDALSVADSSGQLRDASKISDWVRSDPIVSGIGKALTNIPNRRVEVLYSEEAHTYLEGIPKKQPGVRLQIASPDELVVSASCELFGGQSIGLMVWNAELQRPQYEALDPAGLWHRHNSKRWQYHGYTEVFDIPSDRMILMENDCGKLELQPNPWVLGKLSTNRPWFEGHWHKLAYKVMQAQLSAELRDVWQNAFSMPIIVARTPQGASNDQRAKFTESILGAFLRVIGVTPGYDVEMKQATAEGADVFTQSEKNLIEAASIAIWGTLGLIQGGSGFANADLFEQMAAEIISAFAAHLSRRDNDQIWWKVLWWANKRGHISKSAINACVEYQTESAAVIERKAKAAKALTEVGVPADEARRQSGLTPISIPEAVPISEVRPTQPLPEARAEEEPEPTYSEGIAAALNERNEVVCPCPNKADRHCPRCGVVRRQEVRDGRWADVWHATRRRAA